MRIKRIDGEMIYFIAFINVQTAFNNTSLLLNTECVFELLRIIINV